MKNNKEVTCRRCGTTLALAMDTEGIGFIVHSPTQTDFAIHIVPHGRTSIRCSRCGAIREWYPPHRTKGSKKTKVHTDHQPVPTQQSPPGQHGIEKE